MHWIVSTFLFALVHGSQFYGFAAYSSTPTRSDNLAVREIEHDADLIAPIEQIHERETDLHRSLIVGDGKAERNSLGRSDRAELSYNRPAIGGDLDVKSSRHADVHNFSDHRLATAGAMADIANIEGGSLLVAGEGSSRPIPAVIDDRAPPPDDAAKQNAEKCEQYRRADVHLKDSLFLVHLIIALVGGLLFGKGFAAVQMAEDRRDLAGGLELCIFGFVMVLIGLLLMIAAS